MNIKSSKFLYSFLLIFSMFMTPAWAQIDDIDVGDIESFGISLLGKQVRYEGVLQKAYACQLPSNKGNQCLVVSDITNEINESIIVPNGAYSISEYKKWIREKTLLSFTGTVEMRDVADATYKENTKSPILIGEKISIAR